MNEQNRRLLELERRILRDRAELNNLTEQCESMDNILAKEKIIALQHEVSTMMRQLEIMRNLMLSAPEQAPVKQHAPVQQPAATVQQIPEGNPARAAQTTQVQQTANYYDNARRQSAPASPIREKDFEKTVGRSLMGIFASVLIFISIILFATVILPFFGDTAKMITTYVVSAAFLSVGLLKSKKDPENKFFLALTGCGVGALYISLLLSCIYFKAFGEIVLYILLTLWSAGILYLAKKKGPLFQIIGEAGIAISLIFGCIFCSSKVANYSMFPALLVFCLVSTTMFYIGTYKKHFNGNLIHNSFQVVNLCILGFVMFINMPFSWPQTLLFLVLTIVAIVGCFLPKNTDESIGFGIIVSFYMSFCILNSFQIMDKLEWNPHLIAVILPLLFLSLVEWKKMEIPAGRYFAQGVMLLWLLFGLSAYDVISAFICPVLLAAIVFIGFLRQNPTLKYGGVLLFFVTGMIAQDSVLNGTGEWVLYYLLACAALAGGLVLQWWRRVDYSKYFKYFFHIVSLLFLAITTPRLFDELISSYTVPITVTFILCAVINLAMMKSVFGKDLLTDDPEPAAFYNVLNSLCMMVGTFCLVSREFDGFELILMILTTLSVYMVNTKNLLDKRDDMILGVYVGIKMTLLSIAILYSFHTPNFLISIVCLLIAIGAIVLGFLGRYKSLRVFGLVLSMISTFKLVMIDISYDNTLGHAASFFVSGILCFAISMIYNYIDKKFNES